VLALVAAVAHADADVVGALDHLGGAFEVEYVQVAFAAYCRFLHEYAPKLGVAGEEKIADKIVFFGDVLFVELAQQLLVDIATGAHQGEFEEAGHGRRQEVAGSALLLNVHQQSPRAEALQRLFSLRQRDAPVAGGLFGGEGLYWQSGHQRSFFFGKKHGEYAIQQLGGRRPLGVEIETPGQIMISRARGAVRHGHSVSV